MYQTGLGGTKNCVACDTINPALAKIINIAPNKNTTHPFDLKHGTDTGGYLRPDEIASGHENDALNNGYSAVAPSVFREACRRWRETLPPSAARVEAYSFVDVGAGKGRVLLLAAELPFRKVVGVELNGELARIARKNVTLWNRVAKSQTKIRVLLEDAMEFRWPRTPLLVYLNNPFECALVERLAADLTTAAASGPGLVDVLYVNPGCPETLTSKGAFKQLWTAEIPMDEADRAADPYGAASDRVSAFRYLCPRNK
jgi:SAM-dependent methyltransferase